MAGISQALESLGLQPGHHVLVHSSLSAFGHVDGGAPAVIRALLDVVGPSGTVLALTLTGDETVGPDADVIFDVADSRSWTGAIPETLRKWPGALRSLHPTHSVAAVGAGSERLTRGHEDCLTPCGTGSPFERLAADPRGVILLLGCDHESNTTLHTVEELAGVDYHLQQSPVRGVIRTESETITRTFWPHRYGTPRCFNSIEPLLEERSLQVRGSVGEASARLIMADGLMKVGLDLLKAAPTFFVSAGKESA